ncbi:hypothetical protein AB0M34_00685 [Nocardia sp. NPDC050193]
MAEHLSVELVIDHEYRVRIGNGGDIVESEFVVDPDVLTELGLDPGDERRIVEHTAQFLADHQPVTDFPALVTSTKSPPPITTIPTSCVADSAGVDPLRCCRTARPHPHRPREVVMTSLGLDASRSASPRPGQVAVQQAGARVKPAGPLPVVSPAPSTAIGPSEPAQWLRMALAPSPSGGWAYSEISGPRCRRTGLMAGRT